MGFCQKGGGRIHLADSREEFHHEQDAHATLPEDDDWVGDGDSAAFAVVLAFLDGTGDFVFKFDEDFADLFLGGVGVATIEGAGVGVLDGLVVFFFLVLDEFPGAGLPLLGAADFGFGGLAVNLGNFSRGHAKGNLFFSDEFADFELAFEEFFEIGDEVFVFGGEGFGGDPAGDPAAVFEFAADLVGSIGEADEFDLGIQLKDAAFASSCFSRKDDGGFDDEELHGVLGKFLSVNDAGVAIEFRSLLLAADFRSGRGDEGNGEYRRQQMGKEFRVHFGNIAKKLGKGKMISRDETGAEMEVFRKKDGFSGG